MCDRMCGSCFGGDGMENTSFRKWNVENMCDSKFVIRAMNSNCYLALLYFAVLPRYTIRMWFRTLISNVTFRSRTNSVIAGTVLLRFISPDNWMNDHHSVLQTSRKKTTKNELNQFSSEPLIPFRKLVVTRHSAKMNFSRHFQSIEFWTEHLIISFSVHKYHQ